MAVKRKIRKGLATKVLCFLNYEGAAPPAYIARVMGQSEASIQRVLDKLESRELAEPSRAMSPGSYHIRSAGYTVSGPRVCAPYLEAFKNRRR